MDPFFDLKFQEKRLLTDIKFASQSDKGKILEAYQLAKKYHLGQERDEGGPYILHCLRVASSLIEILDIKNPNVISAALLHDAAEDTTLNLSKVKKVLGEEVSRMVDNVTRKKLPDETEENRYERKYQNYLAILTKELFVRSIKACDWLDNMTSWPRISASHPAYKRIPRWIKEAETMYLPLARSVSPKLTEMMSIALEEIKRKIHNKNG